MKMEDKEEKPEKLKPAEGKIARLLFKHKIPMSKYKIAEKTGYSWPTVNTYVAKLMERGIIQQNYEGEYEFDESVFQDREKRKLLKR